MSFAASHHVCFWHKADIREHSTNEFVSIYGDGWLFFSQRCAIWCHTLAIFRYSARFSGEDFVLANSMHSAANSRKSVDGSQSSKVISLSSFGIFLDIGFMRTPTEIIANLSAVA